MFAGVASIAPIADQQFGPTCGFEAIENVIQLFHNIGNDLFKRDLLSRAKTFGALIPTPNGYALNPPFYQQILLDYQIPAHWYPFLYEDVVVPAMVSNRVVLAIGDAYFLNPAAYPQPNSPHAFLLTNYCTDESGMYLYGYTGVDSNFPNITAQG